MAVPTLTPVSPWPTRKLPQATFEMGVRTSMNQMSTMVSELNIAIPQINAAATGIVTSAETAAAQSAVAVTKAAEAAASSESAYDSAVLATSKAAAASVSAANAATSESAAAASASAANTDAARAIAAAASAEAITGIPAFTVGDGGKSLVVKDDLSGWEVKLVTVPTVLGPPAVSIRSKIATGRPTDITLAPPTVMLSGGAIATYHIVVDDAPAVDVAATDNAATYSFTPGKPAGSTVRVSVTATDSLGNRSLPREMEAEMVDGYVVTPTILSPEAGTRLKMRQFPVATSAFASYGMTDTHLSTDWMATSDLDRTDVLHQALGSTDLTAHNMPGISVAADMPVHLWARHNGHDVGPSDWAHIAVVATPSRHGEILKDTAGQPAAVVVGSLASNGELPWNIRGRRVWIAVALAARRGVDQSWNLSQSDSNYADIATIENPTNNWQLAANDTSADGTGQYVSSLSTEAHMDGSFTFSAAVKNSKELTNAVLAYNANYMAAKFCRAVTLADGFGAMDLPSIDVLMRIYQARTVIDSLDSTATANAAKKLTAWGFGSADGACVWSASEYGSANAWHLYSGGNLANNAKLYRFGCVPALEIPA